MAHVLQSGVTFCTIGSNAVFLDLPGDRYFRLPDAQNAAFLMLAAGERPDSSALTALNASRVVVETPHFTPIRPISHPIPSVGCPAITTGDFRICDVARAFRVQRRIERKLGASTLIDALEQMAAVRKNCAPSEITPNSRAARTIRAFEFSKLLRSSANRCLQRSIALSTCLAREGIHADVVLAVKLGPFAAHCWAQIGDQVLNDTPEEVARFTPILVA